jgi:hypothetical protein
LKKMAVLLLALVVGCPSSAVAAEPVVLAAGHERRDERLLFGTARTYALHGLLAETAYEARVSYAGSDPARFTLAVTQGGTSAEAEVAMAGRHLLDTERVRFVAPAASRPAPLLTVHVSPLGVVPPSDAGAAAAPTHAHFHVLVEPLMLGGVAPARTLPMLLWLVVVLAAVAAGVYPRLARALHC